MMQPIAHHHCDLPSKFGLPRQSGFVSSLRSTIVFCPEYRRDDALRGLEEFSHIWLLWSFSETPTDGGWSPTVRPPRCGGNVRKGVFATRSPFRPNRIGLSCVRLETIEFDTVYGPILHVSGADLMDGTPIFDIKPYIPETDCRPEASNGFVGQYKQQLLEVVLPEQLAAMLPADKQIPLVDLLAQDPRPAYHNDPERRYGFPYAGFEVSFRVEGTRLIVEQIVSSEDISPMS